MELQVKEETGFSAIEMLLCIVIVVMIGFVGYYIYHTQKAADATYKTASQTAQSNIPKNTKIHILPKGNPAP